MALVTNVLSSLRSPMRVTFQFKLDGIGCRRNVKHHATCSMREKFDEQFSHIN